VAVYIIEMAAKTREKREVENGRTIRKIVDAFVLFMTFAVI